jgi:putative hydrolase of the HAD superfamily
MKTTAFIFDIGNVLIDFDLPRLLKAISNHSRVNTEDIHGSWTLKDTIDVETGKVDPKDHYQRYADSIGLKWGYDAWKKVWADIYTINDNGMAIFFELKEKGFPVYLLSNLAEYNKEAIEMKFRDFFTLSSGNYFSYELGLHKPDPKIFLSVCSKINTSPEQCFFIDDLPENVEGARAVGMQAVRFSRNHLHRVRSEIRKILAVACLD